MLSAKAGRVPSATVTVLRTAISRSSRLWTVTSWTEPIRRSELGPASSIAATVARSTRMTPSSA